MNRTLQFLNLIGILALGILSASQWRLNQHLNLEVNRLESVRLDQSAKLEERDKTIKTYFQDLEDLRRHLTRLTAELKENEGKLRHHEILSAQLTQDRDQLKENVKQWAEAVQARDEQINAANGQIRDLAANANEAILKFNELASNYNAVVTDLNQRTRQFNELVAKYNEVAKR